MADIMSLWVLRDLGLLTSHDGIPFPCPPPYRSAGLEAPSRSILEDYSLFNWLCQDGNLPRVLPSGGRSLPPLSLSFAFKSAKPEFSISGTNYRKLYTTSRRGSMAKSVNPPSL